MSITINMFGRRFSRYSLALINGVTNALMLSSYQFIDNVSLQSTSIAFPQTSIFNCFHSNHLEAVHKSTKTLSYVMERKSMIAIYSA